MDLLFDMKYLYLFTLENFLLFTVRTRLAHFQISIFLEKI